jgi:hypothetical protein
MADELYLSLWYPNFRTTSLGAALLGVIRQFALAGGRRSARIHAAAAYPISWNEPPVYQRIYEPDEQDSAPELAVPAALEALHDDFAYEFELRWDLWAPESEGNDDALLDPIWVKQPHEVRIVGYGPEFDDEAYEQNGQIRIDLGLDTPFLQEEVELDGQGAEHIRENVKLLVDFTNAVQQHCGISSRLLWSDSGESLAHKLIARLQQVN